MAKGDFDSPSKPATDAYRRNYDRIWGKSRCSIQDMWDAAETAEEVEARFDTPERNAIIDRMAVTATIRTDRIYSTPNGPVAFLREGESLVELSYGNGCPIISESN